MKKILLCIIWLLSLTSCGITNDISKISNSTPTNNNNVQVVDTINKFTNVEYGLFPEEFTWLVVNSEHEWRISVENMNIYYQQYYDAMLRNEFYVNSVAPYKGILIIYTKNLY